MRKITICTFDLVIVKLFSYSLWLHLVEVFNDDFFLEQYHAFLIKLQENEKD